ncbi:MAG: hypothetical protein JJ863_24915 [Deltaproteobacteria bacterium]|nr:hypothetical protein [Deltaproteobacteria bacterium]
MRFTFVLLTLGLTLSGCSCSSDSCSDGRCIADVDAAPVMDGSMLDAAPIDASRHDAGSDMGCAEAQRCGGECCEAGDRCYADSCISDLGSCSDNDECVSDSYCGPEGFCVPYGVPSDVVRDEECEQAIDIEAIEPEVQCSFTEYMGTPEDLQSTPLVIDFDFDGDPSTLHPSIAFIGRGGTTRVIDGATCEWQYDVAPGFATSSSLAVGDVDLDGRADIVGSVGGRAAAFRYDPTGDTWEQLWAGATCDGMGGRVPHSAGGPVIPSPSLHDLDDDGSPEVIMGGSIYDASGCLLAQTADGNLGFLPVVADVDEDGEMEMVSAGGVYRFDATMGAIVRESYFSGSTNTGSFKFAAVGDLGDFPLAAFGGADRAEIVVVGDGEVRVETLEGTRIYTGSLPSGRGGPPTIADFDGDGRAEFAAAAHSEYVVFDLDCTAGGDPAGCMGMSRTDGRLWSQAVQETSSGVTGSSVFDFDADGVAEVVYHDECFVRIFEGATGDVLYSFPRSSLTWLEMPVIADVDGDFHTEIVVAADNYTGSCPATDPYLPSVSFAPNQGIYVLRDQMDRWAASRPIWNQHAYSVTHVDDRGVIRRTADVDINWRTPGLNNFRQNVQGELEALGIADLTASVRDVTPLVCDGDEATVSARICNRGRLPLGGGIDVSLRVEAIDGEELCRTRVEAPIGVGECQEISCTATAPSEAVDVYVVPDPDGLIEDCHPGNGWGVLENVECVDLI